MRGVTDVRNQSKYRHHGRGKSNHPVPCRESRELQELLPRTRHLVSGKRALLPLSSTSKLKLWATCVADGCWQHPNDGCWETKAAVQD